MSNFFCITEKYRKYLECQRDCQERIKESSVSSERSLVYETDDLICSDDDGYSPIVATKDGKYKPLYLKAEEKVVCENIDRPKEEYW